MTLNIDSDRRAVELLRIMPKIDYPVYHWVKHHTTAGYVISEAEETNTTDFDEFLDALGSLIHSKTMGRLALPSAKAVDLKLSAELVILDLKFSTIKGNLSNKKERVLSEKESPDRAKLITEINYLLKRAEFAYDIFTDSIKYDRKRLREMMPALKDQSTPGETETKQKDQSTPEETETKQMGPR